MNTHEQSSAQPSLTHVICLSFRFLTMKYTGVITAFFLLYFPFISLAAVDEIEQENLLRIARKTSLVRSNKKLFNRAVRFARPLLDRCFYHFCFALDGSDSIGSRNYEIQKEFVLLIAAIIGAKDRIALSAVQYGSVNVPISNLDGSAESFIGKLRNSKYQNASETVIAFGLGYCISQLGRAKAIPSKLVIFGDSGATLGAGPGQITPVLLSDFFLRRSPTYRKICAVTVNFQTKPPLFVDVVGGEKNRNLVIDVESWPLILNQLKDVIRAICARPLDF